MRLNFQLLLLLFIIAVSTQAQNDQSSSLNIGSTAPPLRVHGWIKGTPIQQFEKGTVYVVEFWATWCKPCIAAMPHLSALAGKYKDKVTILGIDIYEKKTTSIEKVKAFVDSMGRRMDYHVAAEDSNFMVTGWLDASGDRAGIPRSFVVNAEGRLAWIGHPKDLDEVLQKIVNNTWDIKEALTKRNLEKYLKELDDSINFELNMYQGDAFINDYIGKPDSALFMINEIVRKEQRLKYAPRIAYHTFFCLLKTRQYKAARDYGKILMLTPTYEEPAYEAIFNAIKYLPNKVSLPTEIYQLGAEAYQAYIDQIPYPEIVNMHQYYNNMAEFYWHVNNKSKAIAAQQKAIEIQKSKKNFPATNLAEFEARLQKYEKM